MRRRRAVLGEPRRAGSSWPVGDAPASPRRRRRAARSRARRAAVSTASGTASGSSTGASSASHTPSGPRRPPRRPRRPPGTAASSRPRRARAASRAGPRARSPRMAAMSASRPTKEVRRARRLPGGGAETALGCGAGRAGAATGRCARSAGPRRAEATPAAPAAVLRAPSGLPSGLSNSACSARSSGPGSAPSRSASSCRTSSYAASASAGRPASRRARRRRAWRGSSRGWPSHRAVEFGQRLFGVRPGRGRRRGGRGARPGGGPPSGRPRRVRSGRSARAGPCHRARASSRTRGGLGGVAVGQRARALAGQPLETVQVDVVGRGAQPVAALGGGDGVRAERPAQPADQRLQRARRVGGRVAVPHLLHQDARGHAPAGPQGEHGQQGAQPRAADRDGGAVGAECLGGAEDAVAHGSILSGEGRRARAGSHACELARSRRISGNLQEPPDLGRDVFPEPGTVDPPAQSHTALSAESSGALPHDHRHHPPQRPADQPRLRRDPGRHGGHGLGHLDRVRRAARRRRVPVRDGRPGSCRCACTSTRTRAPRCTAATSRSAPRAI